MSDDAANTRQPYHDPYPKNWKLRTGLPEAHHEEGALLPPLMKKALPAPPKEIDLPAPALSPVIVPVSTAAIAPVFPVTEIPAPVPIVVIAPVSVISAPALIAPAISTPIVPVVVAPPVQLPIITQVPAAKVSIPPIAPVATSVVAKQVIPVPRPFVGIIDHPIARAPQVIPFATKTPTLFKSVAAVYTQPLGRADEWLPWMRTSHWPMAQVAKRVSDVDIRSSNSAHGGLPAVVQKQVPPPASLQFKKIMPSAAHGKLSSLRVEDKEARMIQRASGDNKFSLAQAIGHAQEKAPEALLPKPIEADTLELPQVATNVPAPMTVDINKLVEEAVTKKVAEMLAQKEAAKVITEKEEKGIEKSVDAPTFPQEEVLSEVSTPVDVSTVTPIPIVEPQRTKTVDEILHDTLAGLAKKAATTSLEGRPVKMEIKIQKTLEAPATSTTPADYEASAPHVASALPEVPAVPVSSVPLDASVTPETPATPVALEAPLVAAVAESVATPEVAPPEPATTQPVISDVVDVGVPAQESTPEPELVPALEIAPVPEPYVPPTPEPASQETLAQVAAGAVDSWDDMLFGLPVATKA